MSSDSDSDICDFTSNVNKISKGFHQFWEDFSNKASEKENSEKNTSIQGIREPSNNISSKSTSVVLSTKQTADQTNSITKEKSPATDRKAKRPRPNVISGTLKEEINPVVSVNILWKSVEKHCFKVYKYQTLGCIIELYCKKFNVNRKLLFFTLDDKPINLDETSFVSLRLNENKQIEGGILANKYLDTPHVYTNLQSNDPLKFEVQYRALADSGKEKIIVSCQKNDKMDIIYWQVSRSIETPVESIRLYFDDFILEPSKNISEMNLEDGDCFGLQVLTKTKFKILFPN